MDFRVKKGLNRYIGAICMLTVAMALLTGCSGATVPAEVNTTSLVISSKGEVTSYLVDVFDKDYYNISDLTAMAIEEAADYNTKNQKGETIPVTVEKVEARNDGSGKVVVTHKYDSTDTYEKYNNEFIYFGMTDGEELIASSQSYTMNLVNVKDGTVMSKEQRDKNWDNKHVIITDAKAVIYCPYKVSYVSEGAKLLPDGGVDTTQAEGTVMILLKK